MPLLSNNPNIEHTTFTKKHSNSSLEKLNIDNEKIKEPIKQNESIDSKQIKKKSKSKQRCLECKKKLGLLGMTCRCGGLYSTSHFHPEVHTCTFDHKTFKKNILKKNLVKVDTSKVPEI